MISETKEITVNIELHRKAITAGVTLLDQKDPGWFDRINVDRLDMLSDDQDVLRQLYPDRSTRKSIGWLGIQIRNHHGFDLLSGFGSDMDYKMLTRLWVEVVKWKRIAAGAETPTVVY